MSNQTLYSDYMREHITPLDTMEERCLTHREAKQYTKQYCIDWWNEVAKETGWILIPPDLAKIIIEDVISTTGIPDNWFQIYYDKLKEINFIMARFIDKGLISVNDSYTELYKAR